jgi:hypothetical protein
MNDPTVAANTMKFPAIRTVTSFQEALIGDFSARIRRMKSKKRIGKLSQGSRGD